MIRSRMFYITTVNCTACIGIQRYIEDYQARCITTFKTYCQKRRSYLLNLPEGMLILRLMCLMANLYRVECYKQVNILIYCGMTAAWNARDASSGCEEDGLGETERIYANETCLSEFASRHLPISIEQENPAEIRVALM